MEVGIGICAYNEEKNIGYLLESILCQNLRKIKIKEIFIVSDGSTDKTDSIVRGFISLDEKVKLVTMEQRSGKWVSINKFLEIAVSPILVLASADIILDKYAIENLCSSFIYEEKLGIACSRPVPVNSMDYFMGYVANLQWYLHHVLSKVKPKFCELIAFRNVINRLPPTLVDEEYIGYIVRDKGYASRYIPESIFFNKGSENLRDFIVQRKRIYLGHLLFKERYNYQVITLKAMNILKCLFKNLPADYKYNILWLFGAVFIEWIARVFGSMDFYFRKNAVDYKWDTAGTTKKLMNNGKSLVSKL